MADERSCEQCGTVFTPRREHARFCSARCRVAWNREESGARTELSPLDWALSAMREAADRLRRTRPADPARVLAVISEAVWWVTIVDATLVRYYPDVYDEVLDALDPAERRGVEEILGGLRFVRNQLGLAVDHMQFIRPWDPGAGPAAAGASGWTWKAIPAPEVETLPPRGQAWELTRYRSYQEHLAGRPIIGTFGRAVTFLLTAAARAEPAPESASATASPAGAN